jgi:hypothetical protein
MRLLRTSQRRNVWSLRDVLIEAISKFQSKFNSISYCFFYFSRVQFKSYGKILRALSLNDLEYIYKEYDAGGLKLAAIRTESEFGDFYLNSGVVNIAQNIGNFGINSRNITFSNSVEKTSALEKILKHILIYSARSNVNKLIDNTKSGLAKKDDKYSVEIAKNIAVYFFGNDSLSPANDSISKLAQKIDTDNKLKVKSYDQISAGIRNILTNAKTDNAAKPLINAKHQVDKGFFKMLYIATLEKLASASLKSNLNDLTDAEFLYIGIRGASKSSNNANTFLVEKTLYSQDLTGINYTKFQKALNAGFIEKIQAEMQTAIEKMSTDPATAENNAISAMYNIDVINCDYDNPKFTRKSDSELTRQAQSFLNGITSKNKTVVDTAVNKIYESLAKL